MNVMFFILAQTQEESAGLTVAGTLIMTVCIVLVLALTFFCMSRILFEKQPNEHQHAPLDIDTPDVD